MMIRRRNTPYKNLIRSLLIYREKQERKKNVQEKNANEI